MNRNLIPPVFLSPRNKEAHKGDFGRIGIVAGSRGMSGAAVLCGNAALRSGSGLVSIFTPISAHKIVALGNPCYMVSPTMETSQGILCVSAVPELLDLLKNKDVVAVGPGCGTGPGLEMLLRALLARTGKLVVDADGLNQLSLMGDWWKNKKADLILTPHPGEIKRLAYGAGWEMPQSREQTSAGFSELTNSVVLLKGRHTVIAGFNKTQINQTGNPGMAKGGSGDALTGIIAALWGQGLTAFEAASLGAFVHGFAGDLAAQKHGQVSMLASDLVAELAKAFEGVISLKASEGI
jgi:NAD(P)H-hydrate epimerase